MQTSTSILLAILAGAFCRPQEPSKVTILDSKILPDGTRYELIHEPLEELPDLPQSEYDEQDEVVVPVDNEGKILPGFEHLVQPKIIEMKRADILRLNQTQPVLAPEDGIAPLPPKLSAFEDARKELAEAAEELAEYEDPNPAPVGAALPAPADYVNSKEEIPATEEGHADLKRIEEEIVRREEEKNEADDRKEIREDVAAIRQSAVDELKVLEGAETIKPYPPEFVFSNASIERAKEEKEVIDFVKEIEKEDEPLKELSADGEPDEIPDPSEEEINEAVDEVFGLLGLDKNKKADDVDETIEKAMAEAILESEDDDLMKSNDTSIGGAALEEPLKELSTEDDDYIPNVDSEPEIIEKEKSSEENNDDQKTKVAAPSVLGDAEKDSDSISSINAEQPEEKAHVLPTSKEADPEPNDSPKPPISRGSIVGKRRNEEPSSTFIASVLPFISIFVLTFQL